MNPSHSAKDDIIIIRRLNDNIRVSYSDSNHESGTPHITKILLTNESLVGYLTTLLQMLRTDTDPFDGIQFNFPGFPIVYYTMARLHNPEVRTAIRNAARMTVDNWYRHLSSADDAQEDDDASSTTSSSSSSSSSSVSSSSASSLSSLSTIPLDSSRPYPSYGVCCFDNTHCVYRD